MEDCNGAPQTEGHGLATELPEQVSSSPSVSHSEESSTSADAPDASDYGGSGSLPPSAGSSVPAGMDGMDGDSNGWGGPPLMIAVLVAGTFGDMQPFVVLSHELQKAGHRIRLATHANYQKFVEDQGVEFFPLGGDPEFLSKLMVKNRGFLPAGVSELSRQRQEFHNILFSTWDACTRPTPASNRPFLADCIIANPPAAGHVHCAERLGVPLHMVFTMPWSRTWSYPHPLSYTHYRSGVRTLRNRLSYFATETFIYSGTSDIVQKFRVDLLGLEKAPTLGGAAMSLHNLRVPFTYCWSPSLAPKPADWGPHIDVVGFLFLEERSEQRYQPTPALAAFLADGPPPVYIGFGSMVAKDPQKLTNTIFSAGAKAGVRAVMNRGWGKFGSSDPPPSIHLIEHTPHSWLFPRCSALVHHGGAGTTAAGALAGRPQLVVPFFGDQAMWGELIEQHGCGPHPIPANELSEKGLVAALRHMQAAPVQAAAARLAALLAKEQGARDAAAAIHRHLPRRAMLCDLDPTRLARRVCLNCGGLKLSALADRVVHAAEGPRAGHHRLRYRPIHWATYRELAYQGAGGALAVFLGEMAGTLAGPIKLPVQGYCSAGLLGGVRGLGKGVTGLLTRPLRATARLGERAGRALGKMLDRGGPARTAAVWQYGTHVGSTQQQRRSVANVDTPLQGLRAAALALGGGFMSGTASLGAWPAAGYRKAGLLGGVAGAGVGVAALLCHVAGAVVLSAAALLACVPASVEAAGRQVVCWRGRLEHKAQNGEEEPGSTQEAEMLDTLDALERIEAEEGPGDGMAAEGILERYVEWQAMKDLGGGAVENGAQEQAEALEKDEESWQERTQGGTRQKDSGSMKREFPSGNNIGKDGEEESSKGRSGKKRRWWVDMHKRLLCSNIRVRH